MRILRRCRSILLRKFIAWGQSEKAVEKGAAAGALLPAAWPFVLAPRTALGSHFCVALSSAGADRIV
ncbi:hypothetical protein D6783_00255 [Candidatus Woesearchaeota archaeon]|nr:MAG: hypothetical protein D6783_00255 [Candidatus Woesearchaeota archaeon]